MLKQRVVTAIILTVLVFGAVLFFPITGFQVFVGAFWVVASWEWSRLSGMESLPGRVLYSISSFVLMLLLLLAPSIHIYLLLLSLVWWLYAFFLVLVYPRQSSAWSSKPIMAVCGFLVLLPSWVALMQLRSHQYFLFLFMVLFLIVTAADIGAYFTGRAFGKNKLAPEVSPNKTWEGFWGGVGLSIIMSLAVAVYLLSGSYLEGILSVLFIVAGCFLMASFSVVGDLFESMCKRKRGIKDSGNILPGHGGVLDRIDSVTAAGPIFILILTALETFLL